MTKIDDEVIRTRIIDATGHGATPEAAAAAGPISRSTLYQWISAGRLDQLANAGHPEAFSTEARFVRDLDDADNEAELAAIRAWTSHFDKDWRACAEFLARRFPERWRRPSVTEPIVEPMRTGPSLSNSERARALVEHLSLYLDGSSDAGTVISEERRRA